MVNLTFYVDSVNFLKKITVVCNIFFSRLSNGCSRKEAMENDLLNLLNFILWENLCMG